MVKYVVRDISLTKKEPMVYYSIPLSTIGPFNGCHTKQLSVISCFRDDMMGTVNNNGSSSPFEIHTGVQQGCVLAPTLFGIFFSMMLSYAFGFQPKVSTYTQELR